METTNWLLFKLIPYLTIGGLASLLVYYGCKQLNTFLTALQFKYFNDPVVNPIPHQHTFESKVQTGWICMVSYHTKHRKTPIKGHFHISGGSNIFTPIEDMEANGLIFTSIKYIPIFAQ